MSLSYECMSLLNDDNSLKADPLNFTYMGMIEVLFIKENKTLSNCYLTRSVQIPSHV